MNGYVAFFNGKRMDIYAETLYEAKLEALEVFKPAKSKRHLVSVILAEKDGETVVHAPMF